MINEQHKELTEEHKAEITQAYREQKAINPIKNSLKGFFAKKLVSDMKEEKKGSNRQAMFKVAASESGLNRDTFLTLTVKIFYNE